ncbi:MAG: DUF2716 domain-containing protein [Deltaproteobacteria bacterium]|nr:DUF2716 domain-containing protein [Deltaproteobacteria bacterium]
MTNARDAWVLLGSEELEYVLERLNEIALEPAVEYRLPKHFGLYDETCWAERQELIWDLSVRMIRVFRKIVAPADHLYAIDPRHQSYRFYVHQPFERDATLEEMTGYYTRERFRRVRDGMRLNTEPNFRWAMHIYPDGEEQYFVSPHFDFVLEGHGDEMFVARGRALVDEIAADLPRLFCGAG